MYVGESCLSNRILLIRTRKVKFNTRTTPHKCLARLLSSDYNHATDNTLATSKKQSR